MRKIKVLTLVFCSLCFLFSGCKKTPEPAPSTASYGLVTGVEITRSDGFSRYYTDPQKINVVLEYLRLLRPLGPIPPTQEALQQDSYEITVHLQDGSQRIHRQQSDCFAAKDQGFWGVIDPDLGQCLPLLMAQLPSDSKA